MLLVTTSATRNEVITIFMNKLYEISTLDRLNDAYQEVAKSSKWKTNTQEYEMNLLVNNSRLQDDIRNETYRELKTNNFILYERGKLRHIRSPQIRDRIVQKVLNKYILVPELRKYLIYDNYASLKKRGTTFARKRHYLYLQKFTQKYGRNSYILQIDIRKYFDNINHQILIDMVEDKVKCKELYPLIENIINNSSDSDKGLNLGSETPQICAVLYLGYIDNFCKIVKGLKYYGRYMDDIYIFHNDKEYLKKLLIEIEDRLKDIGLEIKFRKTHITKLTHQYTFLQTNYYVTEDLKIIKRLTREKVIRERRKLRKYKRKLENGTMSKKEIYNTYKSWRESVRKEYNCYQTILSTDKLFKELFGGKL